MVLAAHGILDELKGGDRRSIGRVPEVVRRVLRRPQLIAVLFAGLGHNDPVVRLRAGDALEKVSRRHPEWLRSSRDRLLRLASRVKEQEVRWHLAQMLPRIELTSSQRLKLAGILDEYLADRSAIVRLSALQALADLALLDPRLCPRALARVRSRCSQGSPAVLARARRLLPVLEELRNGTLRPKGGPRKKSRRAARTVRG
jgi:HEAT repeat protein